MEKNPYNSVTEPFTKFYDGLTEEERIKKMNAAMDETTAGGKKYDPYVELSELQEKYNKLKEAFYLLLVERIKCDDSDHQKTIVYWNDLAGLKEQ